MSEIYEGNERRTDERIIETHFDCFWVGNQVKSQKISRFTSQSGLLYFA